MLSSLSPARRRLVLVLTGLVVLAVVAVAATLALRAATAPDPVAQDEPGPVLVVPGYGGGTGSLTPLVDRLEQDGREVVVVEPTEDGTGDLQVQADRLQGFADDAMEATGSGSVDVVGYSAGGVIARLWVRDGGDEVVRRVLTLGSPHHGTDVAELAATTSPTGCPTACEQLVPDSDLLRALDAGDETPDGPLWTAVRSTSDETVTPTDSAFLEGALDVTVQDLCPDATTSHGDLPGDPVVLALLDTALGAGEPSVPTDVDCG